MRHAPSGAPSTHVYTIIEPLKWLTGCVFAIVAVHLALNVWDLSERDAQLIAIADLVTLTILSITLIPIVRNKVPKSRAQALGVFIFAVTLLNIVYSELIRKKMIDVIYVPFLIIGAGAVLLSTAGYALIVGLSLALCIPIVAVLAPHQNVTVLLTMFFAGVAISVSVFTSRVRGHHRVASLRQHDHEQASSLQAALMTLEEQLHEHKEMQKKRQQLEDQLRQSQKLEAVGVLAGGVAHDMNNVLGAITSVASLAVERAKGDEILRQDLADILTAARRGSTLTRNLLGFARQGTHVRERFQLTDTIQSVIRLMRSSISKQIELSYSIAPELDDVRGDSGQMSHALMNLCINSVDAIVGVGHISVTARNRYIDPALADKSEIDPGRYVELCVQDTGAGIAPELLPRVFEPFFSTKARNERSGLGLSMVYGTVKECGGSVTVQSTAGNGTRVSVLLPSLEAQSVPERPASVHPSSHIEQRRHILLVDDEPMLRSAGRRLISAMGFEVLTAGNGAEAAASYRQNRDQIALVILDVAMPVMSGVECYARLREIDPSVCVLIASGYARHGDVDALLAAGAAGYLGKPYDRRELQNAIRQALNLAQSGSMTVSTAEAVPRAGSDST
jgi:signal transduction histidine kinase/ActR/RegA family two-component response regulator